MIGKALAGKTILVTGTTGFLGKSVVEKCLRDIPQVGRIYLGMRSSNRRSAAERLEREVLASPAFRRLKEELGEAGFSRLIAEKLAVLELDLGQDGLGLSEQSQSRLGECEVVIHSAAAVEFDNPADLSAQTNLLGAARLIRAVEESGSNPHLVHVSTAYVGGLLRGMVREELPHDPGLNWRQEAEILSRLRPVAEEESRRPERLEKLWQEARGRIGPAGVPALSRSTERLRERWVKERLIERGRAHARVMGFSDIYAFTKAMAERAVVELHGEVPLSIVRPAIIESSLREPFPGWLEGFRMAEPIILAFARAVLPDFSGLPDGVLDIIPADYVVNTVLAVAANPPAAGEYRIYHAASGSRNPLRLRQLHDEAGEYFTEHPLRGSDGQVIGTPTWTFPPRGEVTFRGKLALRAIEMAQQVVERLPLGGDSTRWSDDLHERRGKLERALNLAELYGIYTDVDCVYDTHNVQELWSKLPAKEQERFPFDPAGYTWRDYLHGVHFPTVIKMARADGSRRKDGGPSGQTTPAKVAHSAVALLHRRAGDERVLAVFDVDGTLVETNVIEYFFWMRLRDQEWKQWPAFAARMAKRAPRWLYLERNSRADFQRSFYREYAGLEVSRIKELGRQALEAVTLRRLYPEGIRRIREHKRAGHRVLLLTGALDFVVQPLAEMLEVEVDCASLLVKDGRLTGDLSAPPLVGEARGVRVNSLAAAAGLDLSNSFAYADAISDLPTLEQVGTPVVVNPDARLSQIAGQRGWRIERWQMAPGNWRLPIPDPRPSYSAVEKN
ncbi:MAG: HAD-IB family hydrolase [Candidatus Dormibacteraceae bacterium]